MEPLKIPLDLLELIVDLLDQLECLIFSLSLDGMCFPSLGNHLKLNSGELLELVYQ